MKKQFIAFISFLLVLCTVFSSFSLSIVKAESEILTSDSIYYIIDNYVYDVSVKTTVGDFAKNINGTVDVYNKNDEIAKNTDIVTSGYYFIIDNVKYTVILSGDVDCSGEIDTTDYLRIKYYFLGFLDLDEINFKAADIDESTSIDSSDYLKIKSAFLGNFVLPSSKEYSERKSLVAGLLTGAERLSSLPDIDADINLDILTDTQNINISGNLKANKAGTSSPDFSFILNAVSGDVTFPVSEAYYVDGVLYTNNDDVKYKTNATYSEISQFLASYFILSPVSENGNFVIMPYVDKAKYLSTEYKKLSSYIDNISTIETVKGTDYSFNTLNFLNSDLFYTMFKEATGSENFGSINIRHVFESIYANGVISTNENGIAYKSKINVDIVVTDEAIEKFGEGTPENMTVAFETTYNLNSTVKVTSPDENAYVTVDSIYTPYAFTAYDKLFEIASGVSSQYSEKLTVNGVVSSLNSKTDIKNVEEGVELYKNTVISENGKTEISELYIGDLKYILKIGNSKTSTDLNTENLSVEKTSDFSYPKLNALSSISNLSAFELVENENNYTLNYTLKSDVAIEILKNSSVSSNDFYIGDYKNSDYTLKNASGSITFSKQTFDVVSDEIILEFTLSDGKAVSYEYNFYVNTTDCSKFTVDKSLLD